MQPTSSPRFVAGVMYRRSKAFIVSDNSRLRAFHSSGDWSNPAPRSASLSCLVPDASMSVRIVQYPTISPSIRNPQGFVNPTRMISSFDALSHRLTCPKQPAHEGAQGYPHHYRGFSIGQPLESGQCDRLPFFLRDGVPGTLNITMENICLSNGAWRYRW